MSLFSRLAQGLGKGLEISGKMGLEEQRQNRLLKLQEGYRAGARKETQEFQSGAAAEGREFTTGERESSQKFRADESEKDRQARLRAARSKGAKPDKIKFERTDEMTGESVITFESGKQLEFDPETDTYKERGKGVGDVSEETQGEDLKWGQKMANRQAGLFSGDASDFPTFKSEDKAAEAAAQFRINARKAGTLDEFNTEFAKKGWSYIESLAGTETPKEEAPAPKAKEPKEEEVPAGLMGIFKDFEKAEYDGIANQIIADVNAPESLKAEARDYLNVPEKSISRRPKSNYLSQ